MNKFYAMLFAALVMALSFSQCSKDKNSDDDDDRKASSSSSVSESDLTGTWVIREAKFGTYDISEYLSNETWTFNNGNFRGPFYGGDYYNSNYTYKNGKLTISGGDLYEEEDDYWMEEKFEFSSIKIEGTILTLSGNVIHTEHDYGETYNDRESYYIRLEKQGGNGGDNGNSNVNASDIIGTWYIEEFTWDGEDVTEDYRNESWTFDGNYFYGEIDGYVSVPYSYQNGKLTIVLYSWSDGNDYGSFSFEFTNIRINGTVLTLSGRTNNTYYYDGSPSPYSESEPIYVKLNKTAPAPSYTEGSFQWVRQGTNASGLDEFGLQWSRNANRDVYAIISPVSGASLYILSADDYYATSLSSIYFPIESENYSNVSVQSDGNYNDVIATVYNGKTYLINVTRCSVGYSEYYGTTATITGSYKRFDYTK